MSEELTRTIVAWATQIAGDTARLPSRQARDAHLAARRRDLLDGAVAQGASESDAAIIADACVDAARRILSELLAQRAGIPEGKA